MDWRESLRLESDAHLAALVATGGDFRLDEEQPDYRGGTHYVTLGRYRDTRAVFKFFVAERRWRNEAACLTHYQGLGLVPRLFHLEPERLIVMESLGGTDVLDPTALARLDPAEAEELSREIGAALGRLASVPLPAKTDGVSPLDDFSDWGWNRGVSEVVRSCLRIGRLLAREPSPATETLARSLARLEERLPAVEREACILFHEDVSNLRVAGTRFLAFYDLELCRVGTVSMQLGAALGLCPGTILDWGSLVAGFETNTGIHLTCEDHRSVLAMNHLSAWLRITQSLHGHQETVDDEFLGMARERAESYVARMIAAETEIRPFL